MALLPPHRSHPLRTWSLLQTHLLVLLHLLQWHCLPQLLRQLGLSPKVLQLLELLQQLQSHCLQQLLRRLGCSPKALPPH